VILKILSRQLERLQDFCLREKCRGLSTGYRGSIWNIQTRISGSGSLWLSIDLLQSLVDWPLLRPSWHPTNITVQWAGPFASGKEPDREEW